MKIPTGVLSFIILFKPHLVDLPNPMIEFHLFRPLNNFILKKFVVFLTEIVVSVLARNFKRHIGDIGDDRMDEIDGTLSWGLGDLPDEV